MADTVTTSLPKTAAQRQNRMVGIALMCAALLCFSCLDATAKWVNRSVDPTFAFMPLDHDGKIRMDCSSPHAMANLIGLKDTYDLAFGNDTDSDRHGIVTRGAGLMNPNHYLAVAVSYLFQHRPGWRPDAAIGKTINLRAEPLYRQEQFDIVAL